MAANPLAGFQFAALDDSAFGEDAVREEVIAPLLRALGYTPSGRYPVLRSKRLNHPYVHLGSKRKRVDIIPDYTLLIDGRAVMVLDAKAPNEDPSSAAHLGQAYSYAMHPEIRCPRYAVCNGRRLVVCEMSSWDPEMDFDLARLDEAWDQLEASIGPDALTPRRDDFHTSWFNLLGTLLSPKSPAHVAGDAAYRLSWYMPAVSASREAAAKAAMANLSDAEVMTVLRAGAYLYRSLMEAQRSTSDTCSPMTRELSND